MLRLVRNYITRRKVEKALGFELYKWQVDYIFNDKDVIVSGGRGCGKTLAHQLRLLLDYKSPPLRLIPLHEFKEFTDLPGDGYKSLKYTKWYAETLHELRCKLISHNIKVRKVVIM